MNTKTMTCVFGTLAVMVVTPLFAADKPDPRLATVRSAWVEPVDELGDDQPVSACFAQHLETTTPFKLAASKSDAEVVLRIKAHLPSERTRRGLGDLGFGNPSVELTAQHADGTVLWKDGAKLRSANYSNVHQATVNVPCGLANQIADSLRDAMRKARDK